MAQLINTKDNNIFNLPIRVITAELGNTRLENIRAVDLLYLYDLINNGGKFGGNRATNFFSKDVGDSNSISRKFIEFQRTIDNDKDYPKKLEDRLLKNPDLRKALYFKLFGTTNKITGSREVTLIPGRELQDVSIPKVSIVVGNPYYSLLESVGDAAYGTVVNHVDDIAKDIISGKAQLQIEC
jgi:hypothetical protein